MVHVVRSVAGLLGVVCVQTAGAQNAQHLDTVLALSVGVVS